MKIGSVFRIEVWVQHPNGRTCSWAAFGDDDAAYSYAHELATEHPDDQVGSRRTITRWLVRQPPPVVRTWVRDGCVTDENGRLHRGAELDVRWVCRCRRCVA